MPEPGNIKNLIEPQDDMEYQDDASMIPLDETGRRMSDCEQEEDEEPPLCYK